MKRLTLGLALLICAAALSAQDAPPFTFPVGSADGTTTGTTTANEASNYIDMTPYSRFGVVIEYDVGVTGNVYFECLFNAADTPADCGSDTIPFAGSSNLSALFTAPDPVGRVRVRFADLVGTDSTHKVRAKVQGGK